MDSDDSDEDAALFKHYSEDENETSEAIPNTLVVTVSRKIDDLITKERKRVLT